MTDTADPADRSAPRSRLFRKYLYSFVALAFATLAVNSALDAWFSFGEQKLLLAAIQREQAADLDASKQPRKSASFPCRGFPASLH